MSARLRSVVLVAWVAAGCLPAGDPPQGQHLLDGRDNVVVSFQRTIPGAPARLLVFGEAGNVGPIIGLAGSAVYEVGEPDRATGRSQKILLLDHALFGDPTCDGCPYPFDGRGRLLVGQERGQSLTGDLDTHLVRVDTATSDSVDLGAITANASLSFDRSLLLLAMDTGWRVRDLDDRETPLPETTQAEMVGNDVYFVTPDDKLFRLHGTALTAAPELAADSVGTFQRVDTARGPLLVLSRPAGDPYVPRNHALFDPSAFAEMPLPGESGPTSSVYVSPSPSGRLLQISLVGERGPLMTTLFDRDTGMSQTEPFGAYAGQGSWRPGHEELWIRQESTMLRWQAGAKPEIVPDAVSAASFIRPGGGIFTPDGRYWLTFNYVDGDITLRSADDLTAEPLDLTPPGTSLWGYWPLPDGRGVAETYTTYQFHDDLSLVDPATRTSRSIGSGGYVVAAGAHRVLALLDYVKSTNTGTLTLIDLDTGAHTVLGENVRSVALEAGPLDADRLATGKRVAFLVQHRIAGPYDGLWMVTLP